MYDKLYMVLSILDRVIFQGGYATPFLLFVTTIFTVKNPLLLIAKGCLLTINTTVIDWTIKGCTTF